MARQAQGLQLVPLVLSQGAGFLQTQIGRVEGLNEHAPLGIVDLPLAHFEERGDQEGENLLIFREQPKTNIVENLVSDVLQQRGYTVVLALDIFLRLAHLLIVYVHEVRDGPLVHDVDPLEVLNDKVKHLPTNGHGLVFVHDALEQGLVLDQIFHALVDGVLHDLDLV